MRNCQLVSQLEAEQLSVARTLCRRGVQLSGRDQDTVIEVYSLWVCLAADLGYLHPEHFLRDSTRLLNDMLSKDVYDLNSVFAELLQFIRLQHFRGFKALCRRISGHLYTLVKDDFSASLQGNVHATRRLVQLFSYTGRLSLLDIDLTQQCLEGYLESEDYISSDFPVLLTDSLNRILRGWLKSFKPVDFSFRHGSGSVADRAKSLEDKYKLLASDDLIRYVFKHTYEPTLDTKQLRVSRTIFVPKSYKTFRTISMEPTTLQYLQQGVWREIDRIVDSNSFLRNHIDFHDQLRNQRLAILGSKDGSYATLDLSAASDSVGYDLVKKLFHKTKLLPYLMATRSRETVLPDGRQIKLKKFAPMGSALCFPVETLIFAAICQLVTQEHGVPGDYSVYGDDMVVPTQCVRDVANVLSQLGFRLNREKSFFDRTCRFRESCGIECMAGLDVTPIRVSRWYKSDLQPVEFHRLIDMANQAYDRDFRILRSFLLRKLFKLQSKVLFGDVHLLGDEMSNFHLEKRWNRNLQRLEVKTVRLKVKYSKADESIRLRHWLEQAPKSQLERTRSNQTPSVMPDFFDLENDLALPYRPFISEIGKLTVYVEDVWTSKPYHQSDQAEIDFWFSYWRVLMPVLIFLQWKGRASL